MRRYFIVSQWWDRVMGWWLWIRGRPRCARRPFEPAPSEVEKVETPAGGRVGGR